MIDKIHSHRNIIGFDENGVPTVTLKASEHSAEDIDAQYRAVAEGKTDEHGHTHEHEHHHDLDEDDDAFIRDYMNAVSATERLFHQSRRFLKRHQILPFEI